MGQLENLRLVNRARVVDVLRRRAAVSRSELAELTGLSRTTVASVVADLQARGLVVERRDDGDSAQTGRGRPPMLLSLNAAAGAALGITFGHERLQVAVADLSSTVLAERAADLDVDHEPASAIRFAVALAEDALREAGIERGQVVGAAVGLPSPVDRRTQQVYATPILSPWVGIDVRDELSQALGLPVEVENDANLGALGEVFSGAARGFFDVAYVMLSDGVGGGLVLGGQLYRGSAGIAGELGHVRLNDDGELCRCGQRGCLETVASTGAVLRPLRRAHGDDLTFPRVLELAAGGDLGCRRVLNDAGRAVGRVLADVCNDLDPDAVVIGGALSAAGAPLLDGVRSELGRHALPALAESLEVRLGSLGERAALLGAIGLVAGDTDRIRSDGLPALAGASS
jgi:predicted NBD/HSP70 family sugar kinase